MSYDESVIPLTRASPEASGPGRRGKDAQFLEDTPRLLWPLLRGRVLVAHWRTLKGAGPPAWGPRRCLGQGLMRVPRGYQGGSASRHQHPRPQPAFPDQQSGPACAEKGLDSPSGGTGQACHTPQLPEPLPGKHGSGRERAGWCHIPWCDACPRGPTLALFFSTNDNCPLPRPYLCRTPSFSCMIPSLKPYTSPKDRAVTSVTYKEIGALSGGCLSCPSTRLPHGPRCENALPNHPHACPSSPPPRRAAHSRLVTARRALASPPRSALVNTVKSL